MPSRNTDYHGNEVCPYEDELIICNQLECLPDDLSQDQNGFTIDRDRLEVYKFKDIQETFMRLDVSNQRARPASQAIQQTPYHRSLLLSGCGDGPSAMPEGPNCLRVALRPQPGTFVPSFRSKELDFCAQDIPSNVIYEDLDSPIIKYATPMKLVEKITSTVDNQLIEEFMLTFRCFMTTEQLAWMLGARLVSCAICASEGSKRQQCMVRTFVLLRHWITCYWELDFCAPRGGGASGNNGDGSPSKCAQILLSAIGECTGSAVMSTSDICMLKKLTRLLRAETLQVSKYFLFRMTSPQRP